MGRVKILDCTLRDGGYINNWSFGFSNMKKAMDKLVSSGIEIIECGFLSDKGPFSADEARFSSVEEVTEVIPAEKHGSCFVAMVNYGSFSADNLPDYDGKGLDGIRVAFHKKQLDGAMELCEKIKAKGYMVFVQPMVSLSYSDKEFISLIERANSLKPYAFYMVDSHGSMKEKEVARYFYLSDNNLSEDIALGFHSHNNLQLSYSNAQFLVNMCKDRELIIDSSIYGMGRGAGNLNTELFIGYLNQVMHRSYDVSPVLRVIDEVIEPIFSKSTWGYSLPHYLSASYRCHQNYAGFLRDKQTLTFEDMNTVFSRIPEDKRDTFDKELIEQIYISYQSEKETTAKGAELLRSIFEGRSVAIIAPGKSMAQHYEAVRKEISDADAITVAVNHIPDSLTVDHVFVSNQRRYEQLRGKVGKNLIITSNINAPEDPEAVVNYAELINRTEAVEDNVTLLLIKLLIELGSSGIMLAGVDGYAFKERNFVSSSLETYENEAIYAARNRGLSEMISQYSKQIPIRFITPTGLKTDI